MSETGKRYPGDRFYPIRSEDDLRARQEAQAAHSADNQVSLLVYCKIKGISNPVQLAGMGAFTRVTEATVEAWDTIFKDY